MPPAYVPAVGPYANLNPLSPRSVTIPDRPVTIPIPAVTIPDRRSRSSEIRTFALRNAVQRHPMVLYVPAACAGCDQAREFLLQRGVPFNARIVSMPRDDEAFRALGFIESRFPAIAVGLDLANGFEAPAWTRMLDGAGYPEKPQLPPTWKPLEAVPLV
jgi:hypothetical protein